MALNYDSFKTQLPYPKKEEYTVWYFYKSGVLKFDLSGSNYTPEQLMDELSKARKTATANGWTETKELNEEAYRKAKSAYNSDVNQLQIAFLDALLNEYGVPDDEFGNKLVQMAWDDGHSSGFSEVENNFSDYSDLYEIAKRTFQK